MQTQSPEQESLTTQQASQEPSTQKDQQKKKPGILTDIFQLILIIIFIVIPFRVFIAQPFIVSGTSMEPGFSDRDYLIVDQLSYRLDDPERGDVVVFRYPNDPKIFYIKRIIGLPGETITVQDNAVFVETLGSTEKIRIEEPYTNNYRPENSITTLLDDQYYVMGDNRLVSSDSRVWGPLDKEFLSGRAFIRLFPFDHIDYLPENYKSYPDSLSTIES